MVKSLICSIMQPYFGVIIFPLTVRTNEEYWIEWYITILFDCRISCVSLWVPYNQTPPIFMTPGEISGNTNQPGISRGFLQFCFLLLGTTKSSLFYQCTPYENRANSTLGYPPPSLHVFCEPVESDWIRPWKLNRKIQAS